MNERKKIISQVMDKDCICDLWKFAQSKLDLDTGTEEGVTILTLLALAWITGAHQGLAFPEITSSLLAGSDEVHHVVQDTWIRAIGDDFPDDVIDNLVRNEMEFDECLPVVSLVPKDFSPNLPSN